MAIVATADEDRTPRTAPFGSVRATSRRQLPLISARYHDTYGDLARDGGASIAVLATPDVAVCIRGRARVKREHMAADPHSAIVAIQIE